MNFLSSVRVSLDFITCSHKEKKRKKKWVGWLPLKMIPPHSPLLATRSKQRQVDISDAADPDEGGPPSARRGAGRRAPRAPRAPRPWDPPPATRPGEALEALGGK